MFPFPNTSFEALEVVFNISGQSVTFCCLYRPPPSRKNKFTPALFHEEIQPLLEHYAIRPGKCLLLGDINMRFDKQNYSDTKRLCLSLADHSLSQFVSEPTHRRRNIKHESTTTCIVHTLRDTHHTLTVVLNTGKV